MTHALTQVAHDHHERILSHVDRLPAMADALLTGAAGDATSDCIAARSFFTGTLVPHIDAAERSLYPVLEGLFQNRHSMRPMRTEHDEIRRLVTEYVRLTEGVRGGPLSLGRTLELRRVVFRLYALLKIHLAEEEAYLRIIDRGGGAEMGEVIAAALEHPVDG